MNDAADLALLVEAARDAGEIALRWRREGARSWEKAAGAGPVSEADLEIDRMLHARLLGARPDHGWLSEETEDDPARLGRSRVLIVDPIDGTRAYLRGEDGFCIALALAVEGEIVAAAAHFPAKGETFSAAKGGGAFRDGARLRVSERAEIDGASALAGRPQMVPSSWPGGPPPVNRSFRNSLVERHCLVAAGVYDLAFTLRAAWEWDVAAGALIAAEAGATVTTAEGGLWRYNAASPRMPGVVAGPAALHADILARLRPAA